MWYAKDVSQLKYRPIYGEKDVGGDKADKYKSVELSDGTVQPIDPDQLSGLKPFPPEVKLFTLGDLVSKGWSEHGSQPVEYNDEVFYCPSNSHWKTTSEGISRLAI